MKIFYHIDNDGKLAAFLVKEHYKKIWTTEQMESITGYTINYGMDFPFDIIEPNELVYIVDYSISPDEMRQLHDITENIVWIDHHKSAIEKYANFEFEIDGLRSIEAAGCVLTYCYLELMDEYTDFDERMLKSIPDLVRYIGTHDIGIKEYPGEYVNYGVQSCETDPMSDKCIWNELLGVNISDPIMRIMVERGKGFLYALDTIAKDAMKYKAFPCELAGLKCYAVNMIRPYGTSKWFEDHLTEEQKLETDLYIIFNYNGSHYTYTLFKGGRGEELDIDVSKIAMEFGGGGHKGAAGFNSEEMLLHKEKSEEPDANN